MGLRVYPTSEGTSSTGHSKRTVGTYNGVNGVAFFVDVYHAVNDVVRLKRNYNGQKIGRNIITTTNNINVIGNPTFTKSRNL